jgi:hypothetical protein
MRVLVFAAVSVILAGAAFGAASPAGGAKPPAKPLDVRKTVNEKCGAPYGIVDLNGTTASKQELEDAKLQVTAFITQADVYQDCVVKITAALDKSLTPADIRFLATALKISQDEKEAVGNAFNNAVCEYNAVNKIADADCKNGKWIVKTVEQASSKPAAKPATTPKPPAKTTTPAATTTPKTP